MDGLASLLWKRRSSVCQPANSTAWTDCMDCIVRVGSGMLQKCQIYRALWSLGPPVFGGGGSSAVPSAIHRRCTLSKALIMVASAVSKPLRPNWGFLPCDLDSLGQVLCWMLMLGMAMINHYVLDSFSWLKDLQELWCSWGSLAQHIGLTIVVLKFSTRYFA